MIRLLLSILIIFCGALIGLHLSQRLYRRREILSGFEKLFHRAQIQIGYNAGDLCEAFGDNFASFVFQRGQPFDEQWGRFVNRCAYSLTKDDVLMLRDFTRGLGAADGASEQKHLALYTALLQEHIQAAQEEIKQKTKVYRIVPLSVGMVIALMMV